MSLDDYKLVQANVSKQLLEDLGKEAQAKQYYLERCEGAYKLLGMIKENLEKILEFPIKDSTEFTVRRLLMELKDIKTAPIEPDPNQMVMNL